MSPVRPVRPVNPVPGHRPGRTHAGRAMALVVTLSLLTACTLGPSQRPGLATSGTGAPPPSATSSSGVPLGPGGPGQQSDPIRWSACSDADPTDPATGTKFTVECGSVVISRPSGDPFGDQVIELSRARAAGVPDDAPNLLVLSGEPGQNGRDRVASVAGALSPAVRDKVAVIAADLTGTGQSAPVNCLSGNDSRAIVSLGADPTEPATGNLLADLSRSLTFECGDLAGAGLSLLNTTAATDDLDTVRAALGTPTLDVLGVGYGATLAAIYADRYPGRVGRMVLDAPTNPLDPMDTTAAAVARASEKALDAFGAACPTFTGGCPLGADPRDTITQLVAKLDASESLGTGRATGGTVLFALLMALGEMAAWPELAAVLASAVQGDTTPVEDLLDRQLGLDGSTDWLIGSIIYRCNDSSLRISQAQISEAVNAVKSDAPLFGPFTTGLVGLCASWPAPETALGAVTGSGAPPILVLGAVGDPFAPYEGVQSLAGQLASAGLVSWQSGEHGSYPAGPCVTGIVDAYLLGGTMPDVGALCPP